MSLPTPSLLLHILIQKRSPTLPTIISIMMLGHKASNPRHGTILSQPYHLIIPLDTIILECLQRNSLIDALRLLGLGVHLLLPLFAPASKTEHEMESGFLLDIVVGESAAVFELFSGEDESLLIRGDALLVLNFGLDIVNGVGRFDIEGDGLAREGFDKYLHDEKYLSVLSLFARQLIKSRREDGRERLGAGRQVSRMKNDDERR